MKKTIDLAFVVPFVSSYAAKDYKRAVTYLNVTLSSLRQQKTVNTAIYLVSNDRPPCNMEGVEFIGSDISIINPDRPGSYQVDKERKLALGISAAANTGPTYIMCVDGDDIIFPSASRRILSAGADLVSFGSGWVYNEESGEAYISPNFFKMCGTSLAFRTSAASLPPAQLDFNGMTHESLIKAYWTVSGHKQDPKSIAERLGLSYASIIHPVAVYRVWPSSLSASLRRTRRLARIARPFARALGFLLECEMKKLSY